MSTTEFGANSVTGRLAAASYVRKRTVSQTLGKYFLESWNEVVHSIQMDIACSSLVMKAELISSSLL